MKTEEIYCILQLTENEHYVVEDMLRKKCLELNIHVAYYRNMKNGHIPLLREFKVIGDKLWRFWNWMKEDDVYLDKHNDTHEL